MTRSAFFEIMWNDTDPFLVPSLEEDILLEASGSSVSPPSPTYEIDESSYSIFFSTYNPSSPVYAQNSSEFGISVGMLKFCIEGVGITTVAILGVIGNMLSICVLSSSRMKNSVSCFLICLAICDIVALVGATILIGIPSLLIYHPEDDGSLFVFNKNIVKYANIVPSAALFAISVTGIFILLHIVYKLKMQTVTQVFKAPKRLGNAKLQIVHTNDGLYLNSYFRFNFLHDGFDPRKISCRLSSLFCPKSVHLDKG